LRKKEYLLYDKQDNLDRTKKNFYPESEILVRDQNANTVKISCLLKFHLVMQDVATLHTIKNEIKGL